MDDEIAELESQPEAVPPGERHLEEYESLIVQAKRKARRQTYILWVVLLIVTLAIVVPFIFVFLRTR